ncbi:MAG: O-methyltransferase [Lactobacillales bacterium]|jgi:predicted O-methyltransferase YrrM|nr:O-methyltransferase [Lactobacillales bacterium]
MLNQIDRPVLDPRVLNYIREVQRPFDGALRDLEVWCIENRIPIIPHETAVYLNFMLELLRPKSILEVGTAVGFSTISFALASGASVIETIERNPEDAELARANFAKFGLDIDLLEGDAFDILPTLDKTYDFIFLDSAKSKYIDFLPELLRVLAPGGFIAVDDIFQGGSVFDAREDVHRSQRTIHRKLNEFLKVTNDLNSTIVPLGDGLLLIKAD